MASLGPVGGTIPFAGGTTIIGYGVYRVPGDLGSDEEGSGGFSGTFTPLGGLSR